MTNKGDGSDQGKAPPPFQVAAVQMDVEIGDRQKNLERIVEFSRQAAGEGARLVVFPECALTGYCFESLEEAREHSEEIPGAATSVVQEVCRELDLHVVFGLIERDGDATYNAATCVGPSGVLSSFRKIHLPHMAVDHFVDPGDRSFAVHDTPLCRLGMNICYDGAFPESSRLLTLAGADVIVLPTNWPSGAEEFALYIVNTRALENTVYYVAANRVGTERGSRFIGMSRIVDAFGRTLAEADGHSETVLHATIDPARARDKKTVRVPGKSWIDRFADRRPELYGPLTESE